MCKLHKKSGKLVEVFVSGSLFVRVERKTGNCTPYLNKGENATVTGLQYHYASIAAC